MNELGTFEIDEKKLEWNTIKLKSDSKKLKDHLFQIKNEMIDERIKESFQLLENTIIPALEKYSNKMEEIVFEIKKTKTNTIE